MAIDRVAAVLLLFFLVSQTAVLALEQGSDLGSAVEKSRSFFGVAARKSSSSSPFILASDRTQRKDPLNGFTIYTGGWNISDEHYWASVAFTAAPLFTVAAVWFVGFGLALAFICCCHCCCPRRSRSYSTSICVLSLALITLFAGAALVGCASLYSGQGKFHGSTTSTLDFVVSQSNATVSNLRGFSNKLASAKSMGVGPFSLPQDERSKIDSVVARISSAADAVSSRTSDNSKRIQHRLDNARLILVVLSAVMLVLVLLGFIFSLLGIQCFVYTLVLAGWFLVAGTFILSGIFLLLHNVVSDTCVAMDEWVLHPQEHTALDDILPCVDAATTSESLSGSREVTYQLVRVVDVFITNVSNVDYPYNQSGPLMPLLCNPYNPDLSSRACLPGEIGLSNATQVWSSYVCETAVVSGLEVCTTAGRLTPKLYTQMTAAANVSDALHQYGSSLAELANCSFVRRTFRSISADDCPGLRGYSHQVFLGMTVASAAVMLSLVCWVVHAGERSRRSRRGQVPAQGHKDELSLSQRRLLGTPRRSY